ncbi:MAG: single-stranded-DNA-specific exonuclease RecJ [Chlamydiae bacterium]|nr:single-stranded-DNA-specific exonuclease RecJ [Chlamydiota bacterium]MBI3266732.1 single-stranded-DNA-specific exonuclease RecJ [Chlamydiota bacterium]
MREASTLEKIWKVKPVPDPALFLPLSEILKISPSVSKLLIQRGIKTIEEAQSFTACRLKDLSDPYLFEGMDRAVARILKALQGKEKILVHGDYDVDGITGTSLLCDVFRRAGLQAEPYIPDRVNEGYGVSRGAIEKSLRENFRLMITVDCGGTAFEEIDEATSRALDVIVVDHHELKEKLPSCLALIHPRRMVGSAKSSPLAAVGVAFKLAHGLVKEGLKRGESWASKMDLRDFLDRVAIGTLADLVPLRGENRIFVKQGLERLSQTKCMGLAALLEKIGMVGKELTPVDIGFKIAPRMNAAGRVGTAYDTVNLLLSQSKEEVEYLAESLDENNKKRQWIEQQTYEEAVRLLETQASRGEDWVVVLHQDEWPLGVIGIVASRIVKLCHRPTFIISSDDTLGKGSARSIRGFHLCEALKVCENSLEGYGGHAYAAGIKIKKEKISEFRKAINDHAQKILAPEDFLPSLEADLEIPLSEISLKLAQEIERIGPFGQENPSPLFISRDLELARPAQGVGKNHLKLWLRQDGSMLEAMAFGMGDLLPQFSNRSGPFHAAYEIVMNYYGGEKKVQLNVRDLKFS